MLMRMSLGRHVAVAALVGLVLVSLATGVGAQTQYRYTIGFSQVVMNCPYYLALYQGAVDAAERLGVKLIWLNADNIVARQIADMEDLITKKVNGIIVNPVTPTALDAAVKKAAAAKIPIICADRELESGHVGYVGIDQWKAGELAGELIGKTLNGKGKVVEIAGDPGDSAGKGRGGGMHAVLSKKYPGIKIVGPYIAHYNTAEGMARMEEALAAHPDVNLVYTHNDAMGLGALKTLRAAGRKDVLVVGIDGQRQAYEEILKGGQFIGTVINNSYEIATKAMEMMVDHLDGKTHPERVITGTILVTKENVEKYYDPESIF